MTPSERRDHRYSVENREADSPRNPRRDSPHELDSYELTEC
jgi:hypothetical protein